MKAFTRDMIMIAATPLLGILFIANPPKQEHQIKLYTQLGKNATPPAPKMVVWPHTFPNEPTAESATIIATIKEETIFRNYGLCSFVRYKYGRLLTFGCLGQVFVFTSIGGSLLAMAFLITLLVIGVHLSIRIWDALIKPDAKTNATTQEEE